MTSNHGSFCQVKFIPIKRQKRNFCPVPLKPYRNKMSDTPTEGTPFVDQNAHVIMANPLKFDAGYSSMYFDRCNRQVVTTHEKEVRRFSLRRERDTVKISSIGYKIQKKIHKKNNLNGNNFFFKSKSLAFKLNNMVTKFSLDHTFLAFQREEDTVEFINLETRVLIPQKCKRAGSQILDFFWPAPGIVFFVTNNGFEVYQVKINSILQNLKKKRKLKKNWFEKKYDSAKKQMKFIKEHKMLVKWFVYSVRKIIRKKIKKKSKIYFLKKSKSRNY